MEELEAVHPDLADFWVSLCDNSMDSAGYVGLDLNNRFQVELGELEDFGYIVTHETDEMLLIRMEGLIFDSEDWLPCFCIDYEGHEEVPEV